MKTTEYFLSNLYGYDQAKNALSEVIKNRDVFISDNMDLIGQIEFEDASIISTSNGTLYALLKLTYFLK